MDETAVASLFSLEAGVWTIAGILALTTWRIWNGLPAVMAQWVAWRQTKLSAQLAREKAINEAKDGDWARLRGEVGRLVERVASLEDKCDKLEAEVDACRQREAAWMERAIKAEAINQGHGEVKQAAAVASAEMRLEEIDKKGRRK